MSQDLLKATRERIEGLNALLFKAAKAYYEDASPIMSDRDFDIAEKELKTLIAAHPEFATLAPYLKKVGSDLTKTSARVPHRVPMLSIENQYTEADYLSQFDRFGSAVCEEPKFDGISVSLTYGLDGRLKKALTRGDGASGEDMTAQVLACPLIPQRLTAANGLSQFGCEVEVRGELVMRNSTLAKLNDLFTRRGTQTYTSTRNLTAGTMKLHGKRIVEVPERQIELRPWDVIADIPVDSRLARLHLLTADGFSAPQGTLVSKREDVIPVLHKLLASNKVSDVNADGVVMKVDSISASKRLGLASKYTNYQTCFKPQSDKAETYLRKIIWQVGRTGKVSPVAECDPVVLAGATVTRANVNNMSWINGMGLTIGCKIEMLRSGGVIPKIEKVIDPTGDEIVAPTECPACQKKLEVFVEDSSGVITHWCTNERCPGRTIEALSFVGDREVLEIDGLGPEMAAKLVTDGYARDLGELFLFQKDCAEAIVKVGQASFERQMSKQGFSVVISKMVFSMEKAKAADWDRWIAALGIPMVSNSIGKILAKELKLTDADMALLPSTLLSKLPGMSIAGIGPNKTEAILGWARELSSQNLCKNLAEAGVKPTSVAPKTVAAGAPLAGIAFCITGEFGEPRDKITAKLESLGATSKSSVTKKCNLLIVGSVPGASKTKAAAELGVKTVGEDWLKDTFEKAGLVLADNTFAPEEA